MEYRKLGNTDINVSALSFGASSLGSVFRNSDEQESIRSVHKALDLGVNYIDVAPYYGLTKAEHVLGKAIKEINRNRFYLSTKVGRYGEHDFNFSKQKIISSIEQSLSRLNTDYVDILFLHDAEFVSSDIIIEEAIPTLQRLKHEGKIRYAGISGLPLQLFETLVPKIDVDCILSYCHYTLNDTSLLQLVPLIEKYNIGLVNASPLSMGLLANRPVAKWHPADETIKARCKMAAEYCEENGEDIAKLAIQFSTSNASIPTTLVSTANPLNMEKNINWVEEKLDKQLLNNVLNILKPIDGMSWVSGREEYNVQLKQQKKL